MDYKKLLLDRLLDKFEKSRAYQDVSLARRRIMLKLGPPEFPEYNIEKSETRELVNSAVQELREKGLVDYEWLKHERGNIIDKTWLRLENLSGAYQEAGRVAKSEKAAAVLSAVRKCRQAVSLPWIARFLDDVEAAVVTRKTPLPYLPEEVEQAEAVLRALSAVNEKDEGECLERVFSLRCFGDSKFFERYARKKVAEIIRHYLAKEGDYQETLTEEELLALVGIVKFPEQVEFCGELVGRLSGREVSFGTFKYGLALNSPTLAELEITGFCSSVRRALFIENKANYVDYVAKNKREDELVIFHGGFFSPMRGSFFKKIYEAGKQAGLEFYHWGDLDLGGFRMFHRLKTLIIPDLKPFLMDREAFLSQRQHWSSIDQKYGAELEKLLKREDYGEFHDVIRLMLAEKVRLEQEAFLV
ncbi:MAG: DUF2220 family protein [Peptococcaceae bacterium]|jgi:hypothetical protein|nr:DUF2220 domain-containing protein [Peptococcaceae bacterium]MDH7526428.1 DUF2220 family protein [Peptococcaceae bacterium]